MESRRMVLMNLFENRNRNGDTEIGHREGRRS